MSGQHNEMTSLGRLIEKYRQEIEKRWLQRLTQTTPEARRVDPTRLKNAMPDYLKRLAEVLVADGEGITARTSDAWKHVAREHGVTRVDVGFNIRQLVREFSLLRQVIREVANEVEGGVCPEGLLADVMDGAVEEAVQAYVDSRDAQLQQRQAQHVGFLTHELRNPLSTAFLATARLRSEKTTAEQRLSHLAVLDRAHRELARLIDGVLLAERLASGKVTVVPVDVTLGALLEQALESAIGGAAEKGLTLDTRYDAGLALRIDPLLTRAALQNVVDNAVKYTDAGRVEVVAEDLGAELVVRVVDDGPGIAPEHLKKIFEPFERGVTQKSGSGLGLAIARRALEAQGGSVSVESDGRHGCCFRLRFPKRLG